MLIRQFFNRFSINNRQISTCVLACIVSVFINQSSLIAQIVKPAEAIELAESSILLLKDHYLVVRLHTNQNAIKKLEEFSHKSTKPTDAYDKKAALIKEDRDWENKNMIRALKKNYTFSKLLFIPEDKFEAFLDGNTEKVCLNDDLELVDLHEIPEAYILLSRVMGHHYDWVCISQDGQTLNDPFPSYFRLNGNWNQFIKGLFKPNAKNPAEKYDALAQKISDKMQKYYITVTY